MPCVSLVCASSFAGFHARVLRGVDTGGPTNRVFLARRCCRCTPPAAAARRRHTTSEGDMWHCAHTRHSLTDRLRKAHSIAAMIPTTSASAPLAPAHWQPRRRAETTRNQHNNANQQQQQQQYSHQASGYNNAASSVSPPAFSTQHPHQHQHQQQHQSHRQPKRRRLPHFFAPEAASLAQSQSQSAPALARAPSAPLSHATNSPHSSFIVGGRSQSMTHAAASRPRSHHARANARRLSTSQVSFMNGPPRCELPPNYSVSYAKTREEADVIATDLLRQLRSELDARSASDASCACPLVIGFDLEWRPNFVKGYAQNPVALLQLATRSSAYLFQIIHWARPPSKSAAIHRLSGAARDAALQSSAVSSLGPALSEILLDPRILKSGIGIKGDAQKLLTDYGLRIDGMLDLSDYANERLDMQTTMAVPPTVPFRNWSLAALVAETLGGAELAKPKKVRMGNWELHLSSQQQEYAALDAYVCCAIFDQLHRTHTQQRNCVRALSIGIGETKRPKSNANTVVPVEVVVRHPTRSSSASPTRRGESVTHVGSAPSTSSQPIVRTKTQGAALLVAARAKRTIEVVDE